jgi:heterotetrameric sarcosine oxidase delta subunit
MLAIPCPWCGPRDETEFSYGGEAHIVRPADPQALSDEEWANYVFMRANTKGPHRERWVHSHGCRRWFNVERNTATNEIIAVYRMDETAPRADAAAEDDSE